MTEEEVRKLLKDEFHKKLKEYGINIEELPIQIRKDSIPKSEVEKSGIILDLLCRIKKGLVFIAKAGYRVVGIIFLLYNLYGPFEFLGEVIIPGSIPEVREIAAITRKEIIEGYNYLTPYERNEPESFVAFNRKWETLQPEEYRKYISSFRESTMDDFVYKIENPSEWQFISASGIRKDILASSTNISISSSASSSASPSPEDIEKT